METETQTKSHKWFRRPWFKILTLGGLNNEADVSYETTAEYLIAALKTES